MQIRGARKTKRATCQIKSAGRLYTDLQAQVLAETLGWRWCGFPSELPHEIHHVKIGSKGKLVEADLA